MKWLITGLFVLCVSFVKAGSFGENTKGAAYFNIENNMKAGVFTCDSTATLDSIKGYIKISGSPKNLMYLIYKASDSSLVDTTVASSFKASDSGWVAIAVEIGATVYADTSYVIVVWGASGGGVHEVAINIFGGDSWQESGVSFGDAIEDPWIGQTTGLGSVVSIEAYYTVAEEAAAGQMIMIQP